MFGEDDLFGDLFDLDGDGKTSFAEAFIIHELFASDEELKLEYGESDDDREFFLDDDEDDEENNLDISDDAIDDANCGSEDEDNNLDLTDDNLDVEEVDFEDEHDDFIEENDNGSITIPINVSIKFGDDDIRDDVKRSDYPNERMYKAADLLDSLERYPDIYGNTDYSKEIMKCRFILDNPNITAAKYLNYEYGFLFAQAVKERFKLPVELPEDDDAIHTSFPELFRKIARYNTEYAIRIWHWVLTMFSPYIKYGDDRDTEELTSFVMCDIDEEQLRVAAVYAEGHSHFVSVFLNLMPEIPCMMEQWICLCIQNNSKNTAKVLFEGCLSKKHIQFDVKENFVSCVLDNVCNYDEIDTVKFFRDVLLPIVIKYADKPMKRKLSEWQSDISEYIKGNTEAIDSDEQKTVCPKTHQEVCEAEKPGKQIELNQRMTVCQEIENGTEVTQYIYCAVLLPSVSHPYHYRTTDAGIKIGDKVVVPVGEDNEEMTGTVVSVEFHTELTVPYPLDRTKFVLKKA